MQIIELAKNETKQIAESAAQATKSEILEECQEILNVYEDVKELKSECKYYLDEARAAAQKAGLEAQAAMNLKVNEELEMLRSLRLRLESDYDTMNKRINSAWEMLRGEASG